MTDTPGYPSNRSLFTEVAAVRRESAQITVGYVRWDDPPGAPFPDGTLFAIPAGVMLADAKVYVNTAFDSGVSNTLVFAWQLATAAIGALTIVFANVADVSSGGGGAAVTGQDGFGTPFPQFLPLYHPTVGINVYVGYDDGGGTATQGEALVVLTLATVPALV